MRTCTFIKSGYSNTPSCCAVSYTHLIGYNGAYMLPECIICVVLALAVGLRLTQQLSKAK